eukprot:scaffold213400_cov30-Prasinocladus_malaysianus.AAC.1
MPRDKESTPHQRMLRGIDGRLCSGAFYSANHSYFFVLLNYGLNTYVTNCKLMEMCVTQRHASMFQLPLVTWPVEGLACH